MQIKHGLSIKEEVKNNDSLYVKKNWISVIELGKKVYSKR